MFPRPSPAVPLALGAAAVFMAAACASISPRAASGVVMVQHVDKVSPSIPLAGDRCRDAVCRCRVPGDDTETLAPVAGMKRFEIRMSAAGGSARFESPALGAFASLQGQETCYYIDLVAGATNDFVFSAHAQSAGAGVSPRLSIAEYGPAGPYWYDTVQVACAGAAGTCDRRGAEAWMREARARKRGRLDPCGSAVVTGLRWDTSGGQSERDGGLFRDFSASFTLEVKKFATRFAPGSTECVPK